MMFETIEYELNILNSADLADMIPSYLNEKFKDDLNERIIPKLVIGLDHIIESINTNSHFKIKSTQETNYDANINNKHSFSNLNIFQKDKSVLTDISTFLCEIICDYNNEILNYIKLFQEQDFLCLKTSNLKKSNGLMSSQSLIEFQRAIVIQKLKTKHYKLLHLIFQSVFDIYRKMNDDFEKDLQNINNQFLATEPFYNEENCVEVHKQMLLKQFHEINTIL
jgi:hypothetical protein